MAVSQAIRDTMLTFVCVALILLTAIGQWLMDEQSVRKMKEKLND